MSGKIKEYAIKKLFFTIPIEVGATQEDTDSEHQKKKSHTAMYLKTRHSLEHNRKSTNQSRKSPTKRTMKPSYSAIPACRLGWSRESRQTLR